MQSNLYDIITEALGVCVVSARPLSGGCIGEVYRVELKVPVGDVGISVVVAKVDQGSDPHLDVEGFMLRYLAEHSALPVPRVLHSAAHLLIMEYVAGDSDFSSGAQQHAADLLAALHGIRSPESSEGFGLHCATLIGGLDQPNRWTDGWVTFFCGAAYSLHGGRGSPRGACYTGGV